jgi:hypothetical protein
MIATSDRFDYFNRHGRVGNRHTLIVHKIWRMKQGSELCIARV